MLVELVALFLLVLIIFLLHFHWNGTVRKVNKFPGPPTVPILGNVLPLLNPKTLLHTLTAWKAKYGSKYRLFFGYSSPMIIISSPEDAEIILSSQDQLDKGEAYYPNRTFFGEALITAGGDKWRKLRKIIAPSFHYRSLDQFLRIQNEYSREFSLSLATHAKDGNFFNIVPLTGCCTAATIIHTTTGTSAKSLGIEPQKLVHATDILARNWWNRFKRPWLKDQRLWKLSMYGKLEAKAMNYVNWLLDAMIKTRKEEFAAGKLDRLRQILKAGTDNDDGVASFKGKIGLLDSLLMRQADGDAIMSDEEIRFNITTIIGAGYDTSGLTVGWLLYNLGKNPQYQALVHQELDSVFSDDPQRDVTTCDLSKLKYMDACIKETLRLFPAVPIIIRKMSTDMKINGAVLPKDSDVMIYIYGIQRDPSTYSNPETFDPSRFLPANEARRHKFAFIPFSGGPRNCIGMRYAIFQVKAMAVHILRKYSVASECDYHQFILIPDVVLTPENGINIALTNRHTM